MSLRSFGSCPWCGASMEMKNQSGVFTCPVCSCEFRHDWQTWAPCLVAALVLSLLVFKFIPIPLLAVFITVIIIGLVAVFIGPYAIITEGREDVAEEEINAHIPKKKKESKWFIALLVLIVIGVLFLFLAGLEII